jgi:DNA helicase-2/ATP-dependent DNA helicase PcrA
VGITRAEEELQLSMATVRSQRGGVTRTVPSQFLFELPRDEMEIIEYPTSLTSLDEPMDRPIRRAVANRPTDPVTATSALKTAAEMVDEAMTGAGASGPEETAATAPPVDPSVFQVGMTVFHPEYGPGKIAALSGQGVKRTGTVNFPVAGQRKFVLVHSKLRCTP